MNQQYLAYKTLRRTIGLLGMALPFVLMLGSIIGGCEIQPSVSHYYYTNMREVLEGTLITYAVFLFCYKGYSPLDNWASNLAGLFCLGIAVFPADIMNFPCQENALMLIPVSFHGTVHVICSGLFFFTLALISIFLFTKTGGNMADITEQKYIRNVIYILCGIVILVCMICLFIYFKSNGNLKNHVVIAMETIMLLAFGFAWLVKGDTFFKDKTIKT